MMTYEEFRKVAREEGFVRWTKSGIVERILSEPGGFWAENPFCGRRHRISNRTREGKIRQIWHCEAIAEEDFNKFYSTMGDLADAMDGKPLRIFPYQEAS